jgi:hypothetical protein
VGCGLSKLGRFWRWCGRDCADAWLDRRKTSGVSEMARCGRAPEERTKLPGTRESRGCTGSRLMWELHRTGPQSMVVCRGSSGEEGKDRAWGCSNRHWCWVGAGFKRGGVGKQLSSIEHLVPRQTTHLHPPIPIRSLALNPAHQQRHGKPTPYQECPGLSHGLVDP